jgi:hypothetical protein
MSCTQLTSLLKRRQGLSVVGFKSTTLECSISTLATSSLTGESAEHTGVESFNLASPSVAIFHDDDIVLVARELG